MKKRGMSKFITGAALGVGLGFLFAPKKGSETRKELGTKMEELLNKVKELDMEEVQKTLEKKVNEIEKELKDLDKEKVLKIAKTKGKELKKKSEDLVKLAVDKGTPILKEMAEEVREKTIIVIKEVLNKLEETKNEAK
ncbi:MAG: YtxH domain-containing protein [Tenericutes bacterium]|nr:YtxH domain-containing protein [Mycoplasmatota bacterium]